MYKFENLDLQQYDLNILQGSQPLKIICQTIDKGFRVEKNNDEVRLSFQNTSLFYRALAILKANEKRKSFTISSLEGGAMLGVMLDASRNAVINVETVKDYIKTLALLGYNTLMLYTEDTFEVENEPYFGHLRGRYAQKELQEIVDFGKKYGIELVPCIQTLAHLNQIFYWQDYHPINDVNDILLVGEARTYTLIDNMLSSLRKSFASTKISIGMDEAHLIGLGRYLIQHGFKDRMQILLEHLAKVIALCKKHGFTQPIMWSDMFLRSAFGDQYYADHQIPDHLKQVVPQEIGLMYWDYYSLEVAHYDKFIKKHKQISDNILFAGGAWKWSGFAPHNAFSLKTTDAAITALKKNGINNLLMTAWGDNGAEASCFSILPALIHASNKYYGNSLTLDDKLCKLLTGISFKDFLLLDKANLTKPEAPLQHLTNNSKFLFYNDLLYGPFDATIKDGYNNQYEQASKMIKKAGKHKYKYIFNTLSNLTAVLSIKAELGKKITKNYLDKNIEALKNNILDIKKTIALTRKFHQSFKIQWVTENKIFGWDIQDIRIGGALLRMEQAIVTLEQYIEGKINQIPELEEPRLNPVAKTGGYQPEASEINVNLYQKNASANIL